jgi:hypothetical protein
VFRLEDGGAPAEVELAEITFEIIDDDTVDTALISSWGQGRILNLPLAVTLAALITCSKCSDISSLWESSGSSSPLSSGSLEGGLEGKILVILKEVFFLLFALEFAKLTDSSLPIIASMLVRGV